MDTSLGYFFGSGRLFCRVSCKKRAAHQRQRHTSGRGPASWNCKYALVECTLEKIYRVFGYYRIWFVSWKRRPVHPDRSGIQEKILISCGASAGLAAAFNAPIAGLLFIFEEVYHCFSPLVALASFFASVMANFISMNIFGLKPVLDVGPIGAFPVKYYGFLVLLGAILGLFGILYQKVLLALPQIYGKIKFIPQHLYGIIPFLLIIPVGLLLPETLGGGSSLVISVARTSPAVRILIVVFVIRFVFSMLSYGGNLPGGIFLPILTLGAILGAIYGNITVNLTGMDADYIRNFIVFAMAGYFTSIGKAPLTAIILVAEMVGSVNQMMPLAVVSFSAFIVADLAGARPVYEALLDRMRYRLN